MINSIKIICLVFIFTFCFYQKSSANDKYLITASSLNVRDTASTNSLVLGKLSINDTVDVVAKTNSNWVKIQYEGQFIFLQNILSHWTTTNSILIKTTKAIRLI